METEKKLTQAQRNANAATHELADDPPANVLTRMTRKTCRQCFSVVLTRPDGTTYGSATEVECPGRIS